MVLTEEKNRLGVSFAVSILLHMTLLAFFALFADIGVKTLPPEARKFIVELFEESRKILDEAAPEEVKRLSQQSRKVERETAPKNIPLPSTPAQVVGEKVVIKPSPPAVEVTRETEKIRPIAEGPEAYAAKPLPEKKKASGEEVSLREESLPSLSQLIPTLAQLTQPGTRGEIIQDVDEGDFVSLDTTEFKYISYFSRLKEKIGMVWRYPEAAKAAGLQGKLVMRFVINGDGSLRSVKVVTSSGISILDDEAVNAVKRAAPFHAVPPNLGESLSIVANFEYILSKIYIR